MKNLRQQLIEEYCAKKDSCVELNPRFNAAYFLIKYGDRALDHIHTVEGFGWLQYWSETWCWVDAVINPIKKGDLLMAYCHHTGSVLISKPEIISQLLPGSGNLVTFCRAAADWPADEPNYYMMGQRS